MGLFSKPKDKVEDIFERMNNLSQEEYNVLQEKINAARGVEVAVDEKTKEGGEQPAEETPKQEEVVNTEVKPAEEVPQATNEPKAEEKPKETYDELFARLREESRKEIEALKGEFDKKLEDLKPKETVETKPFGLTENNKEYSAMEKPKETSYEWLKKHFN